MTKHSKQHKQVLSNHELTRGLNSWYDNQWGTQQVREGASSVVNFDCCRICLHEAVSPLCCPQGHIYCTECIYQFLVHKKLKFKEEMDKYQAQEHVKQTKEREEEEKNQEALQIAIQFEKTEDSIKSAAAKVGDKRKSEDVPLGYSAYKTPRGDVYVVDRDAVEDAGKQAASKEAKENRRKYLPSFWIPLLTPENKETILKQPVEDNTCPFGHQLKRKQLKPVLFTSNPDHARAKKSKSEKGKWMCPMSRKTLTNTTKLYFIKATGDVVTEESAKVIVKDGAYKGKKIKKKDVVKLEAGGSGFAGGGAKTVKSKVAPTFLV